MAVHTSRSSSPGVRHANYVGRHGALVVSLGIGMAMATMPSIALAEPNSGSYIVETNPRSRFPRVIVVDDDILLS